MNICRRTITIIITIIIARWLGSCSRNECRPVFFLSIVCFQPKTALVCRLFHSLFRFVDFFFPPLDDDSCFSLLLLPNLLESACCFPSLLRFPPQKTRSDDMIPSTSPHVYSLALSLRYNNTYIPYLWISTQFLYHHTSSDRRFPVLPHPLSKLIGALPLDALNFGPFASRSFSFSFFLQP